MAERVQVREVGDGEGRRLLQVISRGTGPVVTWRRARMVLLSARGVPTAKTAEVTFAGADRVRDVIRDFSADGFAWLCPRYEGGRPKVFTLPGRREIKKTARSEQAGHGLPFSAWSLAELPAPDRGSMSAGRARTAAGNAEIACTPAGGSWLSRIEARFTALRCFTLDGTGRAGHKERAA